MLETSKPTAGTFVFSLSHNYHFDDIEAKAIKSQGGVDQML